MSKLVNKSGKKVMAFDFKSFLLDLIWKPRELIYQRSKTKMKIEKLRSSLPENSLKLEVGGGETPRMKSEGFLNIDLRESEQVDYVGKAWDLFKYFDKNTVNYIYCRHVLEHLAEYELVCAFQDWQQVCKSGAIIEILVPNINFHISQFLILNRDHTSYEHCIAGFNGWQRCEGQNYWDVHKNIFTERRLIELLKKYFDFEEVYFDRGMRKNVHLIGKIR